MTPLRITIDYERIRANAQRILDRTRVPLIAVIKADAYGHGAGRVVEMIHDLVDGFYCFDLAEALTSRAETFGRRTIVLLDTNRPADELCSRKINPAVWTIEQARALRRASPVLAVDTGMQRFAAPLNDVDVILRAGDIHEAFTHAVRPEQAITLRDSLGGRGLKLHAAATALLPHPNAWLDATRPGLALYEGAARITTHLVEVHRSAGPIGYRGLTSSTGHHGVIVGGYAHGVKPGPCSIGNQSCRIFESGMQSSFIEIPSRAKVGDEVVLLGDESPLGPLATTRGESPQEVLIRLLSARQNPI